VVFTSGGTEANNLALASLSAVASVRRFAAARLEHASVLRPLEALEGSGWEAGWLPVGEDGRVEARALEGGIGLAVLQAANHETGARQPLEEFAERTSAEGVPWHCDAVQAWGRVPLRLCDAGCTTATLSGHKLGAPKGVGVLYVARGTRLEPLLRGGPQERGRRAGTENLPGIAALGAACRAARRDLAEDAAWTSGLRDRIAAALLGRFPLARINGPEDSNRCLPNTLNVSLPGWDGDAVVQALDLEGVAVSAGSACASGALEPSPTLQAMGVSEWRVRGAVRVSLGPSTKPEEVELFLEALARVTSRGGG
jgi:cysteine desulfurase